MALWQPKDEVLGGWSATLPLGLFQGYRDSRAVLTTQMARASFEGAVARSAFFTRLQRIV